MIIVVALALAFAALAVFTLWQARPKRMARLGRNAWIGMRSYATARSDDAWNVAHQAAWPMVRVAALLILISAVLAVSIAATSPDAAPSTGMICLIGGMMAYGVFMVLGFVRANSAANDMVPLT